MSRAKIRVRQSASRAGFAVKRLIHVSYPIVISLISLIGFGQHFHGPSREEGCISRIFCGLSPSE
jgi:hypothetical protein